MDLGLRPMGSMVAMKSLQRSFILLLLGLTALWWWVSADAIAQASGVFAWRALMIQYTGVLALGMMSVGMLLAIRPVWLEPHLHGLDKMYRLHQWLGIAALVFAVAHWLWKKAPKWAVQSGWIERPPRGPRAEPGAEILRFFQHQRGLAEQIGEWAFYAAVLLIVIALVRRFPYRHFFQTHRWLALVYLALVVHSVPLLDFASWPTPLGAAMGLFMVAGSVAACVSLLRRIGIRRKAVGVIEQLEYIDGVHVNAVTVRLRERWAGHEAGQFAFVTFDDGEGAHPFTIASAWQGDGRVRFLIKALGDYTRTLEASLRAGALAVVEGPYGRFNFDGPARRQIWVAGGIGLTPFLARLQALAAQPDGRTVDLFYSTAGLDAATLQRIADSAQTAGVRLHVTVSTRDGRLDGERLRAAVPDWAQADIWFCGPAAFGQALRDDFVAQGLPAARFHQELFELR